MQEKLGPANPQPSTKENTGLVRRLALVSACLFLGLCAWWVVYDYHGPAATRTGIIVIVLLLGASALYGAFPDNRAIFAGIAWVLVFGTTIAQVHSNQSPPRGSSSSTAWAACPRSKLPVALTAAAFPEAVTHPAFSGGLGSAHLDSVIAPDGSANILRAEQVCVTTQTYPAINRTFWLILRLRLTDDSGHPYKLFFAAAEFDDPAPGGYSARIERGCSSTPPGSVHTLMVVSAGPKATRTLWENYNANHTAVCNNSYDPHRHSLPADTFIVSNQGDVRHK